MHGDAFFFTMIFLGIPWILGWIGKTGWAHQREMKALELRAENQARLVDRFGSDANFLELLKASGQSSLLEGPALDSGRSNTYMRMLTTLQIGFILIGAGAAFFWAKSHSVMNNTSDERAFVLFGALGVGLGIGSICSAIAALAVGKMWPQLNATPEPSHRPHA